MSSGRGRWLDEHARAREELRERLTAAFGALRAAAARPTHDQDARPAPGAWSTREVLEHVTLADRYLLILARKLAARAAAAVERGEPWPAAPPRHDHLAALAERSTPWEHPAHMAPAGAVDAAELVRRLDADLAECLRLLDALPAGAATLRRIRMSRVEGDDRLDLDQYLDVIALHAARHVRQVARNREALGRASR